MATTQRDIATTANNICLADIKTIKEKTGATYMSIKKIIDELQREATKVETQLLLLDDA